MPVQIEHAAPLRLATHERWRIMAYPLGGYVCCTHVSGIGWCLCHDGEMPVEIESELCRALGIRPPPTETQIEEDD